MKNQEINLKNNNKLSTPVLFLIFNRPDLTHRVFKSIREAKPQRLYIAADGPFSNNKFEELGTIFTATPPSILPTCKVV